MRLNTLHALALTGTLLLSPVAQAQLLIGKTNYTDVWWNPQQSGWGMNLAEQSNRIYATLHAYDTNGAPLWYVAYLDKQDDDSFSGSVHSFTSTPTSAPLSPGQTSAATRGTLQFVPLAAGEGLIRYNIDGQQGEQVVTRFSLLSQPFPTSNPRAGTNDWEYAQIQFDVRQCPGRLFGSLPSNNITTIKITPSANPTTPFAQIDFTMKVGIFDSGLITKKYSCTIAGHLTSEGRLSKIDDAEYSCTDTESQQAVWTQLPAKVANIQLSSSHLDGYWESQLPELVTGTGTKVPICTQRAYFSFSMKP